MISKLQSVARIRARGVTALLVVLFVGGALLLGIGHGAAASSNISQGYTTRDSELSVGMAVSLSIDSTPENQLVERANRGNMDRFVGIVTTIDKSLLSLTGKNAELVVTANGEVAAFVSDLNGEVHQGDILTVSPLAGILMKAGLTDSLIVGAAVEDMPSEGRIVRQIDTEGGQERTVAIARHNVDVSLRTRQVVVPEEGTFLVLLGESITGKQVSHTQVVVALVIFMMMLVVEGSIIYGAVRNSILAVGRNPLSKRALYKQLLQVSWLALIVLVFGLAASYIVLWI